MCYILFDLDGTLLNSRDGIVKCIQHALSLQGIYINDLDLLERHIGPPLKQGFIDFYGFNEEKATKAVVDYRALYRFEWSLGTRPYPGIESCLKNLRNAGFQLFVATSKPEHLAKEFLDYFGLSRYFDDICGSMEEGTRIRTTKAAVIQYTLEKNHIEDLTQVCMVGDRFHDVEGAIECGIPCIGVTYGFGGRKELEQAGAVAVAESCEDLEKMLLSIMQ